MGKVIIQKYTNRDPILMIGYEAGVCWGADVSDDDKNYKRGLNCIKDNHGRTLEFPQIYITLEGYSARVIRELYVHIAGGPTRLQESTRYVNEGEFDYIIPKSIDNDLELEIYNDAILSIKESYQKLTRLGVPREDVANLLPLGMTSKVVMRTNLRHIIDMSKQRMCSRAYWEFRELMRDLKNALAAYSEEYNFLINELNILHPKCEDCGYCPESKGCGRYPNK